MLNNSIYDKAKTYHLTKEELDFILDYSKKLNLDPQRVLVNKELFQKIVDRYKKESPKVDEFMLQSIKKKLDFINPFEDIFTTTRDFPIYTEGRFYIDSHIFSPIRLEKSGEEHQLWEVKSHKNMDKLKKGIEGFIVVDDNFGRSYRFDSKIVEEFDYGHKVVKIPHSGSITLLQQRKHPRVFTDFEGFVQKIEGAKKGPLYKCKICNISVGGLKIHMDGSRQYYERFDKVKVQFKLDGENIEAKAQIRYASKENYYGLMFEELDFHSKKVIERYVSRHLKAGQTR